MKTRKLKQYSSYGLLLFIIVPFSSCKDGSPLGAEMSYRITIDNSTTKSIFTFYQLNFPDTNLQENTPFYKVALPQSVTYLQSQEKWENVINSNSHNVITIFIMDYDSLQKYGWQTMRSQYKILDRFELTTDSLQKLQWTLTYKK